MLKFGHDPTLAVPVCPGLGRDLSQQIAGGTIAMTVHGSRATRPSLLDLGAGLILARSHRLQASDGTDVQRNPSVANTTTAANSA